MIFTLILILWGRRGVRSKMGLLIPMSENYRKTSHKHNDVGRIHLRETWDKGLISDDEKLI